MAAKTVKGIFYESVLHGEDHHCKIMADGSKKDLFRYHKLRNFRQVHIFVKELWPQLRDEISRTGKTLCVTAPYYNVLEDVASTMYKRGEFKDKFYYCKHFDWGKGHSPWLAIARREGARSKPGQITSFDYGCFLPIMDQPDSLGAVERAFGRAQKLTKGTIWVIGSALMMEKLGVARSVKTRYESIFDYSPHDEGPLDGQTRPETCFRKAIEDGGVRDVLRRESLAVFNELPLRCLMVKEGDEGEALPLLDFLRTRVGEEDGKYQYVKNRARFDFVFATRSEPHRLLLAVEVDGEQHRYGWNGPGAGDVKDAKEAIEASLQVNRENDGKKDAIVELLGGKVIPFGKEGVFASNDRSLLSCMPAVPVLFRLPSDGSSAFEVSSLQHDECGSDSGYFTLEELLGCCADAARDKGGLPANLGVQVFVQDLPGITDESVYGQGGLGFADYKEALNWLEECAFIERSETDGWLPASSGAFDEGGVNMGITAMFFVDESKTVWMCRFPDFALEGLKEKRGDGPD